MYMHVVYQTVTWYTFS